MCPACLTTLVLIVTGSSSVGGRTAFAMNNTYRCNNNSTTRREHKEGDPSDDEAQDGDT